jgi:hypothetical protein
MRPRLLFTGLTLGCLAAACCLSPAATSAQPSKSKAKGTKSSSSTKAIDVRAEKAAEGYVREAATLAREYEDSGNFEKARQMYESIATFTPDAPGLKEKIKQLNEMLLESNEIEIEIDAGRGWDNSRVQVFKGKTIRLQSTGTYNFVVNAEVGPDGFPSQDPVKDEMAAGIPCGALMGLMAEKDKPGKPFVIGNGRDFTPNEDGILFLRFNVPPGSRCTGKVDVRLSGYVRALK